MVNALIKLWKEVKILMEKLFRNEDGHEVTAINEVQANALEAEGFKAVKGSAKAATKNDAEFAEEMNFGGAAQTNATSMDSAQAQAMNSMASQMAANAQDAEFAEEAAMAEFKSTDANNKMNSASKTAAKKTNK